MSIVLLTVLLLSPVAGLVCQAYPACVPDHMENFQPILSQDPGITVPGSWPSRLAQLSYNLFFVFFAFYQLAKISTSEQAQLT